MRAAEKIKISQGKIARAAGVVSAATLISRVLGFSRDMVLAYFLGATGFSDAFYVAFRIPNLLRGIFAEGTMASAFIPVLSEYRLKEGDEAASALVKAVFSAILTVVGGLCVLGIVFAPLIVRAMAPGFVSDPEKFRLTVLLTRIMFPLLLFVSLGALSMGALNVKGVFFIPSLSSAVINLTIMATAALLSSSFAYPAVAAAIGVAAGGLAAFLFQVPSMRKSGFTLKPVRRFFHHPGLKKMAVLALPMLLAMSVLPVNIVVSNILASFLPGGRITYLYYGIRLMHFPVGVFGAAMGVAVLPALSEHAAKGDFESLRQDFSFALRVLFFLSLPAMAGLIALRVPIMSTLFLRGRFTWAAVEGAARALFFYSMGIWAMVGARVLNVTFYSMHDTKGPMKSAITALVSNIVLSVALMRLMKHGFEGLALANALAAAVNFVTLFYLLREKLMRFGARRIVKSFAKSALAAAVMGAAAAAASSGSLWRLSGHTAEKALWLAGSIALSTGIYAILCYLLKNEELHLVLGMLQRRFFAKRSA